jgi:uncharacterized membrane protein YhaH (DUF805 family)
VVKFFGEVMGRLFDFGGVTGRKAFWLGCVVSFIVSVLLLIAWVWQLGLRDKQTATLMILPARLLVLWPSLALYVRRLRDSGRSPFIAISTPGEIADAEQRASEGEYSAQDDALYLRFIAFPFEAGLIAGLPGPFQFGFALLTGSRPSKKRVQG